MEVLSHATLERHQKGRHLVYEGSWFQGMTLAAYVEDRIRVWPGAMFVSCVVLPVVTPSEVIQARRLW